MERDLQMRWFLMMEGLAKDTVIYQYLDFDYLLVLLENHKYHVNAKKLFEDNNESCLPKRKLFGFSIVGDNAPKVSPEQIFDHAEYLGICYHQSKEWFTSCWTKQTREDVLMWKTYTNKCGVRIKSSIQNIVASLDLFEKYLPICGTISYDGYSSSSFFDCAFSKEAPYENEQEIRFYFLPEETTTDARFIDIQVNPKVMIDEVTISPFVRSEAAKIMKEMIENKYSIHVALSKMKIK